MIAESAANKEIKKEKRTKPSLWKGISIVFESRVATVGLVMVSFWIIVACVSLVWTPYDPNSSDFIQNLSPNAVNWLGTDHLGRDLLSRLMQGTQVILLKTRLPGGEHSIPGGVAIWGVLGSLFLGAILGLNAGYRRGWTDQIIMQVLDALIAFPQIVLYLVVIAALGQGDWWSFWPLRLPVRPVWPVSHAVWLWTFKHATISGLPRHAPKACGLSCFGKFCPMPAALCWWTPCCGWGMPFS